MRKFFSKVSLLVINFGFKAYRGLKLLCDPACEGSPYITKLPAETHHAGIQKTFLSFKRIGWR